MMQGSLFEDGQSRRLSNQPHLDNFIFHLHQKGVTARIGFGTTFVVNDHSTATFFHYIINRI